MSETIIYGGMFLLFSMLVISPLFWNMIDVCTENALSNLLKAILNRLQRAVEGEEAGK